MIIVLNGVGLRRSLWFLSSEVVLYGLVWPIKLVDHCTKSLVSIDQP